MSKLVTVRYNFIAKCQYTDCMRNVLLESAVTVPTPYCTERDGVMLSSLQFGLMGQTSVTWFRSDSVLFMFYHEFIKNVEVLLAEPVTAMTPYKCSVFLS